MAQRAENERRLIHPVALALALAIVAGSVWMGIVGPRLREREIGPWIPLADVAGAARQIQMGMQLEATHRPSDAVPPSRAELKELVQSTLQSDWRPPDLSSAGFVPVSATSALLPGCETGIAILYESSGDVSDRFVVIFAAVDQGHFASFDEFGRMEPFTHTTSIIEPDDPSDHNSGATLVYIDAELLVIVRGGSLGRVESVRTLVGSR